MVQSGAARSRSTLAYKLSEAQQVHRDLAGRETTASTVMVPWTSGVITGSDLPVAPGRRDRASSSSTCSTISCQAAR